MIKVKSSLCLTKHYAMETYGGVVVWIHVFLTPALVYSRGPLDRKLDGPHNRSGGVEKRKFLTVPGLELRPLCRRAPCQKTGRK
jgi:hypothetical protein